MTWSQDPVLKQPCCEGFFSVLRTRRQLKRFVRCGAVKVRVKPSHNVDCHHHRWCKLVCAGRKERRRH